MPPRADRRCGVALFVFVAAATSLPTPAAAQPFAYILAQRDDDPGPGHNGLQTLVVLDTNTYAVRDTVPLGLSCLYCYRGDTLGLSPDVSRVFVANQVSGTVSVVDVATHSIVGSLPVGGLPNGLAFAPDGTRLYVLRGASVAVVDLDTLAVVRTITLPTSPLTGGIAITPDGARLYVADFGGTRLAIVDTTSGGALTLPLPDRPLDLDITPDGSAVYVSAGGTNRVFVVDTGLNAIVATVTVGTGDLYPSGLRVTSDGARIYSTNLRGDTLSVIDRATHAVVRTVTSIANPRTSDFTPDGSRAFVTTLTSVTILDLASHTPVLVLGMNPATLGQPTAIEIADPPPHPPDAPTGLVASLVAGNLVTLRWTRPASGPAPTAHFVEGGIFPGQILARIRTASTSPIITLSVPSGAFYVRVRALNGPSWGPVSNEIRIFVNVPQAPSPPAGFAAVVHGSSVAFSWRNTFEGAPAASLALDVTGSVVATIPLGLAESIAFDNAPAGTFTLALRALNQGGSSTASNAVTVTLPGPCSGAPAPPIDSLAFRSGRTITVVWNPAPAGPATTGYVIGVTGSFVGAIPLPGRTIGASVPPGTYNLTVQATNACGASAPTAVQTLTVP